MTNVHKPLAKRVLIPLVSTATASAADAGYQKKFLTWDILQTFQSEGKR